MKPVWAFALWHCAFSSWEEQDGLLRPWREAHGQQLYSDWSWPSNNEWLVLRDPRWVCSTPPHHYQPGLLTPTNLWWSKSLVSNNCCQITGWLHYCMDKQVWSRFLLRTLYQFMFLLNISRLILRNLDDKMVNPFSEDVDAHLFFIS